MLDRIGMHFAIRFFGNIDFANVTLVIDDYNNDVQFVTVNYGKVSGMYEGISGKCYKKGRFLQCKVGGWDEG